MNEGKKAEFWGTAIAVTFSIAFFVGIPLLILTASNDGGSNASDTTSQYTRASDDILTIDKARSFVGKRLIELCSQYGKHNIDITVRLDEYYGGTSCDDLYPGFENFIITRAYYDDKDEYYDVPEEYRKRERTVHFDVGEGR